MFGNIYGLDLGTYEIKVFDKKQDKICRERDVIAIKNKKNIFAIGDKAYEMYEKAPDDIEVVFPMKSGVIARFDIARYFVKNKKTFSLGIGIRCCRSYRCYGS